MQIVVPDEFRRLYETSRERPVLKIPDERLRTVAAPVAKVSKRIHLLADEMTRIMRRSNGVGLAAPQLGIAERVIVVAPEEERPTAWINPRVLRQEGEVSGQEGCLSIPALYGDVVRAQWIEVEATDRKGRTVRFELEGMPARVFLHEVDHLDGVLFIDRVVQESLHWEDPEAMAGVAD